jgi:hypothetical protein
MRRVAAESYHRIARWWLCGLLLPAIATAGLLATAPWWLPAAKAAIAAFHFEYAGCFGCHV